MQYGVYTQPDAGGPFAEAGFDFLEVCILDQLRPAESDAAAAANLAGIRAAPLPVIAANRLLPAALRVTGQGVDPAALERHVETVFRRAAACGIRTLVFGSGGARRVPDDFPRARALEQLLAFGRMMGPLAQLHGVVVAVEPLNRQETNILNGVGECARYCREVAHPAVRLLVDGYHWGLDQDSAEDVAEAGPLLCHAHMATLGKRLAPGLEPCDFRPFFNALRAARYDGPLTIEAGWNEPAREARPALDMLRRLAEG